MHGWTMFAVALIALTAPTTRAADFPPADQLPPIKEFPDLLTFRDGTKVSSPQDWPRRRGELLAMIEHYEYGMSPPAPVETRAAEILSHTIRPANIAHKQFKVTCVLKDAAADSKTISFVLDLMLP